MSIVNMDVWVHKHFKTQEALDNKLGISIKSTNRWMNHQPRQFLKYIDELSKLTGDDANSIVEMIIIRDKDIQLSKEPS